MSSATSTDPKTLERLYQQAIFDHFRKPRNQGPLARFDAEGEAVSRTCGDRVVLRLEFEEDGRITVARFEGQGCAISQASASMLTQALRDCTRDQVLALDRSFRALLTGSDGVSGLGELRAFAGVSRLPARIPCALLAWDALRKALASN